jgi:hypothetical protein
LLLRFSTLDTPIDSIIHPSSTPQPSLTYPYPEQVTVDFERTMIARFTENPTLALSSTPFYVYIIHSEILRQFTETPREVFLCEKPCSLSTPTMRPTSTPGPSPTHPPPRCSPVIANWGLTEQIDDLEKLFDEDIFGEFWISIFSTGLEGIDEACEIPFQPLSTNFSIVIYVASIDDFEHLTWLVEQSLAIMAEQWGKIPYVSHLKSDIGIFFRQTDRYRYLSFNYAEMVELYTSGLRGSLLIDALGGFSDPLERRP